MTGLVKMDREGTMFKILILDAENSKIRKIREEHMTVTTLTGRCQVRKHFMSSRYNYFTWKAVMEDSKIVS